MRNGRAGRRAAATRGGDTREAVAGDGDRVHFEAALSHGGVPVRTDILERDDGPCALVAYCERDTLALTRLVEFFATRLDV